MKNIKQIITALVFIVLGTQLKAQQEFTLYGMNNLYQASYVNPTAIPENKIHIGLPIMSSVYVGANQTFSNVKNLVSDSGRIEISNAIDKMGKFAMVTANTSFDLFSFRINLMHDFNFSFHVRDVMDFRLSTPKNFYNFIWEGNGNLLGEEQDIGGFRVDMKYYREYALGFLMAHPEKKFAFGGRVKFLFGKFNVNTSKSKTTFKTDEGTFALDFSNNLRINTSGLFDANDNFNLENYEGDDAGLLRDVVFNSKNKGIALDGGASYKYNNKLKFSASVKDFGFITWKDNVTNYEMEGTTSFAGVSIDDYSTADTILSSLEKIADTIVDIFAIDSTRDKYRTALNTQIYLNANYQLFKNTSLSGTIFNEFYHGWYPGVVLGVNQRVGRVLNLSMTYWGFRNSWRNLGFGFMVKPGPVQFYMVFDNILAPTVLAKIGGVPVPYNAKNFNLRFGFNIVIGKVREPVGQTLPFTSPSKI